MAQSMEHCSKNKVREVLNHLDKAVDKSVGELSYNKRREADRGEVLSEAQISEPQQGDSLQRSSNLPRSSLVSKNITIDGRRTSVRLEPQMWESLTEISHRERCSIHDICTLISALKAPESSLTASIRVFLMLYYKAASTEEGHIRAKHGNIALMKSRVCGGEDSDLSVR